ncbi:MAG: hypothetical protein N2376_05640 [Clostridia bacterium]|nr:hypothetical protein [Clostridia bacterium]
MKKSVIDEFIKENLSDNQDSQGNLPQEGERLKLEWKDVIAVIIAIYRIFIPWALAIGGIYALLLLIFDLIF